MSEPGSDIRPENTALIYIHSPRYWEIGRALEQLPVDLYRAPYNFWFVVGHLIPPLGWVLPWILARRIRKLPHRNKVVMIDRLLREPGFIRRIRADGAKFVVRLRGNPWPEFGEDTALGATPRDRLHGFMTRNWLENLRMADAVWPLAGHLENVVRGQFPDTHTAVVGSLREPPHVSHRPEPPEAKNGVGTVRVLTATVYMFRLKTEGVLRLYDLMEAAMRRWPGVSWTLCGGGRHTARSRARWQASPLRERIEFPGRVKDLPHRMGEAHVFAYYSEMDVLPNVVLDAMAFGLPVLCNRWGPFPEIFQGALDWCLYDGEAEFLEKLEALSTDADLWRRISELGGRRVGEMFSAERVRRQLEAALADLL